MFTGFLILNGLAFLYTAWYFYDTSISQGGRKYDKPE